MSRLGLFFVFALFFLKFAPAQSFEFEWRAPVESDLRGPCPMMNTLANHGFIRRDGRNITSEALTRALHSALNFDASLAGTMFEHAIIAAPEQGATSLTLEDLSRHNVLEHDASLSRADKFYGDNSAFNQTIFDETRIYWTGPILNAQMLANAKMARQLSSKAFNPTYTFTPSMEQFSLGEVGAPIVVFGDIQAGTVRKDLVEYFFGELSRGAHGVVQGVDLKLVSERLPWELGWTRSATTVRLNDVLYVSELIKNATGLTTGSASKETVFSSTIRGGIGQEPL